MIVALTSFYRLIRGYDTGVSEDKEWDIITKLYDILARVSQWFVRVWKFEQQLIGYCTTKNFTKVDLPIVSFKNVFAVEE